MRILFVASECRPFSKTGGLADVASALSGAFASLGHEVLVSTPRYRGVRPERTPSVPGRRFHFVEHDAYFDRAGLYGEDGADYPDNDRRFAYFARASLDAAAAQGFAPDVVHLHDWQAALAAFLVRYEGALPGSRVVYTVHNLAYQGVFPPATLARVGLPRSAFTMSGLEFHGNVSFMKAGLAFSDAVTTVSPRYAREIQTPAFGFGLEGVLRGRAAAGELHGILNGADYTDWSPDVDPNLPQPYTARRLSPKRLAKAALQRELGLEVRRDVPLLGMVTRLDPQKGVDLVIELAPDLVELGAQLAILGNGDPVLERRLTELAARHTGRVGVRIGFVDSLAHQIQGGSDILLMPSRWEPCGLNQMYAMRYGTVPVVSAVGGLDDTVEEGRTGFKSDPDDPGGLSAAIQRAVERYRGDATGWRRIMRAGMAMDFSWGVSAGEYLRLFASLASRSQLLDRNDL
jgi:starch synthase